MIKFLHTADLHLDAPFAALSPEQAAARRQEQRELLTELAEAANTHDCDLVLLAGDLFDSAGASDETLLALRRALASIRAPVFISPGNHDCLLPGSAYLTERWPENVHIFKTDKIEAIELPEKQLRVYGAGFTARHERPLLEGFRAKADGWTNLMVLHGDATQAASPYNPITPEQLAASGLAYLALGHIHQASGLLRCGSTCYAWPGCAMGRGFDELGQKGAYLGEVSDSGVRLDFLPLHGRSYEILRVEAGDDALAAVTAAAGRYAALRAAVRMLGAGQCSRRRLYEKLRARRIPDADAAFAVETAYAAGYIDEDWQLKSYIRTLTAQKQYGPRKLYAALAAKGYRGDDIRRAMDESFGEEEIRAARRAFLEKKFGKTAPATRDEAAAMRQALYKQGF